MKINSNPKFFSNLTSNKNKILNEEIVNSTNDLINKNLLYDPFSTQISRPSMLNVNKFTNSYGFVSHLVVDPCSSGIDSDEMNSEFNQAFKEPTVEEVCEYMFDINTLRKIVLFNNF